MTAVCATGGLHPCGARLADPALCPRGPGRDRLGPPPDGPHRTLPWSSHREGMVAPAGLFFAPSCTRMLLWRVLLWAREGKERGNRELHRAGPEIVAFKGIYTCPLWTFILEPAPLLCRQRVSTFKLWRPTQSLTLPPSAPHNISPATKASLHLCPPCYAMTPLAKRLWLCQTLAHYLDDARLACPPLSPNERALSSMGPGGSVSRSLRHCHLPSLPVL